jgi:glycerophosphoryl diester phosphodiesterase
MSNLSNQQINQTFNGLLQVPGGVTPALQTVQDGNGASTQLKVSTTQVQVGLVNSGDILQVPGGVTSQLKTVYDGDNVATGLQISTTGINAAYAQQDYGSYANYAASPTMTWIAHRGGAGMAPEDTMSSFANGIALGSKIIECDVQISLDNVPVIIHDSTVDRTTNGTGAVAALNYYSYMRGLDAGSFFNSKFSDSYIPTLDEYFALCRSHNVFAMPEIKGYKVQSNIQLMLDSMNNNNCQPITCWQSFTFSDLQYVRNLDATVSLAYLYTPTTQAQLDAVIAQLIALGGPVELACSYSTVLANPGITWVSSTSAANITLTVWTVDSPYIAKQLMDLGINRIMSNYYLGGII